MAIDSTNSGKFSLQAETGQEHAGLRLDQIAAQLFPEFSRSRLQGWIRDGQLLVNGRPARGKDKLWGGELLLLEAEQEASEAHAPEAIGLDIVFEDEHLIVLDKPAGLVVHPAAGNRSGTLLNALLHHDPQLETIPRAGIVHRLDKDTTGLMVVARTLQAHLSLVEQLREREISRQYQAVVSGVVTAGGTIKAPLGRHPVQRKKRAVSHAADAKPAVTHYRVLERFRNHTHVLCSLETGRTHQIRVHMAHAGFPLVGDSTYGGRLRLPRAASPELIGALQDFRRQALHAWKLGLTHPGSLEYMEWESPVPADIQELVAVLARDRDAA